MKQPSDNLTLLSRPERIPIGSNILIRNKASQNFICVTQNNKSLTACVTKNPVRGKYGLFLREKNGLIKICGPNYYEQDGPIFMLDCF